jgi:hypothetical protein
MIGAIDDLGKYSHDTTSGKYWLDVTLTTNMSYTEVRNRTINGGLANDGVTELQGWRYATGAEFEELMTNFGYAPVGNCTNGTNYCDAHQDVNNQELLESIIETLGDTHAADRAHNNLLPVDVNEKGYTYGFIGPTPSISTIQHPVALIYDTSYVGFDEFDIVYTVYGRQPRNLEEWQLGSFLVRDTTPPSAVPLPAAAWFFLSAIAGVFGLRSRKK